MTEAEYPARSKVFVIHFLRLLMKNDVAQTIGPEGIALLAAIALQEDEKRYAGPVDFWNSQLMLRCGFGGKNRLNRIRNAVVDAGWLHYEQGGKGRPGRYWCVIPDGYQISDPVQNGTAKPEAKLPTRSKTERQTDRQTALSGPKQDTKRSASIPIPHIPKSHMGDGASKKLGKPSGKTWHIDDSEFQSDESAERRFRGAVTAGWINESDRLNFHTLWQYTARQHARTDQRRIHKPGAAFTKAVKNRDWKGTNADEDAAKAAIRLLTKPNANFNFGNLAEKLAVTVPDGIDDEPVC